MKHFDKNDIELKDGDIFDIHQTVNGSSLFLAVTVDPLDIEYAEHPGYKYEYNKEELLAACPVEGVTEFEIVGNIKTLPLTLSLQASEVDNRKQLKITKKNIVDKASIIVYTYADDESTAYLASLLVHDRLRHQGLGRELLKLGEAYAGENGATTVCVKVLERAWMHKWYERCGYTDLKQDETPGYVWMSKQIS